MSDDLNFDLNNISLEDLGSSLLARQAKINKQRQKTAKRQQKIAGALAVLGAGQKIFRNALDSRLKEIDNLQLFELQNNEEQFKRIRGMSNILSNFNEEQLKGLAGPNREWATMSLDEKTEAYMNSPYADLLDTSLGKSIDAAIEMGQPFDDMQTFKDKKTLYNNTRNLALNNAVRFYLEGDKYKEFGNEIEKLYRSSGVEFNDRAELLEKSMLITPHELTKMERAIFNAEKEKFRNIGIFQGMKHGFEKIGRKSEANGGPNLFREVNPDDIYGSLDAVMSNLDITGNLTQSVKEAMSQIRNTDKEADVLASQDEDGRNAMQVYIQQFSAAQNTRARYREQSPYGELLRMAGDKGRYETFYDDIQDNVIENQALIKDTLALDYLLQAKPELAEAIYASKYEQLYGKPADEEAMKLFRANFQDEVYRKNFAVMTIAGEGFKVINRHWFGKRGEEHYDGTGIVGNIEKNFTYDNFSGILPVIRHDGIKTPSETENGQYAIDENWSKLSSTQQGQIFESHYNNIEKSNLRENQKDILIENLFANVPNPFGLTPEDFRIQRFAPYEPESFREKVGDFFAGGLGPYGKAAYTRLKQYQRGLDTKRIKELKQDIVTMEEMPNVDMDKLEDKKFELFQTRLQDRPDEIYAENPLLVSLLYEEEGLGKRRGKIGKQNTRVYKDSEGKLTAGVGHLLTEEEKKIYKEGDEVPVAVVEQWFKNDIKTYHTYAMNTMTKYTPELLNDLEAQAMFASFFYQLGYKGGMGFTSMWTAIEQGDFETAANNVLYNYNPDGSIKNKTGWHRQTPERANRFADFIRQLG